MTKIKKSKKMLIMKKDGKSKKMFIMKKDGKSEKKVDYEKNSKKINYMAICSVLTTVAMVFSYIDSLIPIPIPIPGVKIGISNIAIITVLYVVGIKEAIVINILRIVLTSILFGNITSFWFSITGGIFSILVMVLLKKIDVFSTVGVSVAGGVSHNIGQIAAAVIIMETNAILYYLPVLLVTGTITGVVIGIAAAMVIKRVRMGFMK